MNFKIRQRGGFFTCHLFTLEILPREQDYAPYSSPQKREGISVISSGNKPIPSFIKMVPVLIGWKIFSFFFIFILIFFVYVSVRMRMTDFYIFLVVSCLLPARPGARVDCKFFNVYSLLLFSKRVLSSSNFKMQVTTSWTMC